MLIVISAVASAVALFGALLVGYSTQQTIKGMVPKRDPNSTLVAFPADVEQQMQQQARHVATPGAAVIQNEQEQEAQRLFAGLRNALSRAAGQQQIGEQPTFDIRQLAAKLESVLLQDAEQGTTDLPVLREYALRQLTSQDGTVVLPNYVLDGIELEELGLDGVVLDQIADLQSGLNQQIASLPELQDRAVTVQDIQLDSDPARIEGAIDALRLQANLLGLDFSQELRYDSLQALSQELIGGEANLEGLDLAELETIATELLVNIGVPGSETDLQDPAS